MRRAAILFTCMFAIAHAGPREAAEAGRRVDQGNKLYEAGRYEDALRLYLAAYELSPSPDTLFNVGLAHEKMLAFEQCAIAFRRYIAEGKDAAAKERATDRAKHCLERARVPVKVSSIPPGAAVSIATGTEAATFRGRTPTQLDLAPGQYSVKVEMPGFVAMEQTVSVDVGQRPEIDFPLEKLSILAIEADPIGASVQLGDAAPAPTPYRHEVRAGSYQIKLHKDGYRDVERAVTVASGEQTTLVITLTPLPLVRDLAIKIAPEGEIKIDGKRIGSKLHVLAGDYRIEASAPGRVSFSGEVSIPRERGETLDVDLAPNRSLPVRAALWTFAGVSVGAAIAGGIYGDMAIRAQHDYDRMPSIALADRGEGFAHSSDLLFGLAITSAVVTGVTWWLTRPRPARIEVR